MIRVSIKIKRKSIEVDFHDSVQQFVDFRSLWDYCLSKARHKGIYRVKIIHGRGRDEHGLPFLDARIRERLDGLPGVSSFVSDGGKFGATMIYLSPQKIQKHSGQNDNTQLRELIKQLKHSESNKFQDTSNGLENELILAQTLQSLDISWDEILVLSRLKSWIESGQIKYALELIDEIQIFEIFYSDHFRSELEKIYGLLY